MADPQKLEQTPRSLAKGVSMLLALLAGASVLAYWYEGVAKHHWWSGGYIASLVIPFTIASVGQYLWYVPRRFAWDDEHVEIVTWFGGTFRAPWSELRHWGYASMVFTLEFGSLFGDGRSFQIALNYFTPESTAALLERLEEHSANQKAGVWIGRHGIG